MADFPDIIRPVHEAFRRKKIVCPEQNCYKEMLFFEENGLGQHLRSIHKKEGNAKVLAKARLKTQELYGRETLQYISAISEWKSKVSIFIMHDFLSQIRTVVMLISPGKVRAYIRLKLMKPSINLCLKHDLLNKLYILFIIIRSQMVNILMLVAGKCG